MKQLILSMFIAATLFSCGQADKGQQEQAAQADKGNEVFNTIMERRSVRVYKPEQVPQEKLDTIMQSAIYAPSALNKQSWEVRVVQNPELLKKINDRFIENAKGKQLPGSASRAQEPGFSVFHNSPTLIIVASDKSNPYSLIDCGLLIENILLSAQSVGLNTCVVGNIAGLLNNPDNKDLFDSLGISDNYSVAVSISLGYGDETPQAPARDTNKVKFIK